MFPINPKHGSVLGTSAFPNIDSIPEVVDLAVIAPPAPTTPGIERECVAAGVPAAVIISAGFKECGLGGAEFESSILADAQRGCVRLIGSKCLGVITLHLGLNTSFAASAARPGNVAFISQSGALCPAIFGWSLKENSGSSAFVSFGSMPDVGWGDLIDHLGDDWRTHSIVICMELSGDAPAFLAAAQKVACA